MKFNYLLKAGPFLSILIILLILGICNQKEYLRLKILIWNTPKLSLGTYIGLSTGSGFIISYIITTTFAKYKRTMNQESIKYRFDDKTEVFTKSNNLNNGFTYDKTLIERDMNDPSPTINANFRVIGKTNIIDESQQINKTKEYVNSKFSNTSDYEYNINETRYKEENPNSQTLNDWNNDDYINW
tara:strand:- start:595 stop:1149 length:555 start_codon:yes stop_codon:yes gene_type:complete